MTLSVTAIRSLLRREAEVPVIMLLTVEHADLSPTIQRYARNTVGDDIVSNGNTFLGVPFDLDFVSDDEDAPVARLTAVNVDRELGIALEGLVTPAQCKIQVVLASTPDTIEREVPLLEMRNCHWDSSILSADLTQAPYAQEPWPKYRVQPRDFPSLFR